MPRSTDRSTCCCSSRTPLRPFTERQTVTFLRLCCTLAAIPEKKIDGCNFSLQTNHPPAMTRHSSRFKFFTGSEFFFASAPQHPQTRHPLRPLSPVSSENQRNGLRESNNKMRRANGRSIRDRRNNPHNGSASPFSFDSNFI